MKKVVSFVLSLLLAAVNIPTLAFSDSTNAYMIGDKVKFEGKIYESIIDNNSWSPSSYPAGWKEITE